MSEKTTEYIKLSEYAKIYEVPYRTAFEWWQKGKIKGYQNDKGSIFIDKSYIETKNNHDAKLISQKYFQENIANDYFLSKTSEFIFGENNSTITYRYNIDMTQNIDIILEKTKQWLLNSFSQQVVEKLSGAKEIENEEVVDEKFNYISSYINNILEFIKDKQISFIIVNDLFYQLLQNSPYYKIENNTFNNIPIVKNQRSQAAVNEGYGVFIDREHFINFYIKNLPYMKQNENKIVLSIDYNIKLDKDVNMYLFRFSSGRVVVGKDEVGLAEDSIEYVNNEFMNDISVKLENYYPLLILLKAFNNNGITYKAKDINFTKESILIDNKLNIQHMNGFFIIQYKDFKPLKFVSIENVILTVKFYCDQYITFEHILNHSFEVNGSNDHTIEFFSNDTKTKTRNIISMANNRINCLINIMSNMECFFEKKIVFIKNGLLINDRIQIIVEDPGLAYSKFPYLLLDKEIFSTDTDSIQISRSEHVIKLIETYERDIKIYANILYSIQLLYEKEGNSFIADNFLDIIFKDDIANIENNIMQYFQELQKNYDSEVKEAIKLLQQGDENE